MRYTTVIDISEIPAIYRNSNARLVYLHLALRSGYHDDDRDLVTISIRRLAVDVGLTVSATRHALGQLTAAHLLEKREQSWYVKKWIIQEIPTPRTQKAIKKAAGQETRTFDQLDKQVEEYRQRVYKAVRESSREELQAWLSELKEGRRLTHKGASIAPNQDNIRWLQNIIDKL